VPGGESAVPVARQTERAALAWRLFGGDCACYCGYLLTLKALEGNRVTGGRTSTAYSCLICAYGAALANVCRGWRDSDRELVNAMANWRAAN